MTVVQIMRGVVEDASRTFAAINYNQHPYESIRIRVSEDGWYPFDSWWFDFHNGKAVWPGENIMMVVRKYERLS